MFLDQMIRPDEAAGFEKALKTHQMAKLPRSNIVLAEDEETGGSSKAKRGPETVLDRAVMVHLPLLWGAQHTLTGLFRSTTCLQPRASTTTLRSKVLVSCCPSRHQRPRQWRAT